MRHRDGEAEATTDFKWLHRPQVSLVCSLAFRVNELTIARPGRVAVLYHARHVLMQVYR